MYQLFLKNLVKKYLDARINEAFMVTIVSPNCSETVNGLSKHHMTKLLSLAVERSMFLFHDNFYNQTEGVAMGNPLGPTFANNFYVITNTPGVPT